MDTSYMTGLANDAGANAADKAARKKAPDRTNRTPDAREYSPDGPIGPHEAARETPAERAKRSAVHAPMKKGSVLFYLGGVIHGGKWKQSDWSSMRIYSRILRRIGPS
eukprot:5606667-Pyramimonas_sp.AAC.1